MPKKILLWLVIAFAAFYLISAPADAAGAVRGAASGLGAAFKAVITFFGTLF